MPERENCPKILVLKHVYRIEQYLGGQYGRSSMKALKQESMRSEWKWGPHNEGLGSSWKDVLFYYERDGQSLENFSQIYLLI